MSDAVLGTRIALVGNPNSGKTALPHGVSHPLQ